MSFIEALEKKEVKKNKEKVECPALLHEIIRKRYPWLHTKTSEEKLKEKVKCPALLHDMLSQYIWLKEKIPENDKEHRDIMWGIEVAREVLEAEIEIYEKYLNGDVYGYTIDWGHVVEENKEKENKDIMEIIERSREILEADTERAREMVGSEVKMLEKHTSSKMKTPENDNEKVDLGTRAYLMQKIRSLLKGSIITKDKSKVVIKLFDSNKIEEWLQERKQFKISERGEKRYHNKTINEECEPIIKMMQDYGWLDYPFPIGGSICPHCYRQLECHESNSYKLFKCTCGYKCAFRPRNGTN